MQFPKGRYWWMVSNPDTFTTWSLLDMKNGEEGGWNLHGRKGHLRGMVDAFKAIRKGDWILGYIGGTQYPRGVYALLQCTHGLVDKLANGRKCAPYYGFKKIRDLEQYIPWEEFAKDPVLKNARMVKLSNAGSLFGFTDKEQVALLKLLRGFRGRRYWTYASGSSGEGFAADLQDEVMGLGQDELGDLHKYGMNMKKLARDMCRHYNPGGNGSGNARYMIQFRDEVQPGDVIFVKKGKHRFAGVGIVVGDYRFDRSRGGSKQVRPVKWVKNFDRKSPITFARTTLTRLSDAGDIKKLLAAADIKADELDQYVELRNAVAVRAPKTKSAYSSAYARELTPQQAAARLKRITNTERYRKIVQRNGQRELREVLLYKRKQCEVTGLRTESLLVVSHIKDWKKCTRGEKLDLENVLLLAKNYDAAFDRKLISFDSNGKIVKSDEVDWKDLARIGIKKSARIGRPSSLRAKYLKWHQAHLVKSTRR